MCLLDGVSFPEPTVSDICTHAQGDQIAGELVPVTRVRVDIFGMLL